MDSRKSCWSGTEKTTDNFLIAPRHGLLQYVLEKIALLANTMCVHKLYKVECLNKIYLKQAVHIFYWKFCMEMQKSFKILTLHQLLLDSYLGSVERISPLRKWFHLVEAFLHPIFFFNRQFLTLTKRKMGSKLWKKGYSLFNSVFRWC